MYIYERTMIDNEDGYADLRECERPCMRSDYSPPITSLLYRSLILTTLDFYRTDFHSGFLDDMLLRENTRVLFRSKSNQLPRLMILSDHLILFLN